MIKKTFQDVLKNLAKKIEVSPLLTPEKERELALARCHKRGHHNYQDGVCPCGRKLP